MSGITYKELVERYGEGAVEKLILSIEKMAQIEVGNAHLDKETRLQHALDALNTPSGAAN